MGGQNIAGVLRASHLHSWHLPCYGLGGDGLVVLDLGYKQKLFTLLLLWHCPHLKSQEFDNEHV